MTWIAVRDAMETQLKAVSGIGRVHTYRRHSTFWADFYENHTKGNRVNNWEISRSARLQDISSVLGQGGNEPLFHDTHDIVVIGHTSVNDEGRSEDHFQNLIENIAIRIRQNNRLGDVVLIPRMAQFVNIGYDSFGGVLVHFCEMNYEAIERVGG